jgi:hypothetical protein
MGVSMHLTKEWLEQKYIIEGLSYSGLANLCNCSITAISDNLKRFGIPARPNKSSIRHAYNREYFFEINTEDKEKHLIQTNGDLTPSQLTLN